MLGIHTDIDNGDGDDDTSTAATDIAAAALCEERIAVLPSLMGLIIGRKGNKAYGCSNIEVIFCENISKGLLTSLLSAPHMRKAT